jgi:hypothetical protein
VHEEECEATAEEFWGTVRGFLALGAQEWGTVLLQRFQEGRGGGEVERGLRGGKRGRKR